MLSFFFFVVVVNVVVVVFISVAVHCSFKIESVTAETRLITMRSKPNYVEFFFFCSCC